MPLSNYNELQAEIKDFLDRSDLDNVVPTWIRLAEADMNRTIRHYEMEERSTASFDTRYTLLPPGFLEVVRLHLDSDERPIELVTPLALQTYRQKGGDTSGKPKYYAIVGGQIEVWPTPDAAYTGELYYYKEIPGLRLSNDTNWVLNKFPDVYLYGSLLHSSMYLDDDARITGWSALYQKAVDGINSNNQKAKFGGSGLRMQVNTY